MNKILAVLLSVAMLVAIVPAFSVSAGVGTVENGGFESGNTANWVVNGGEISTTKKSGSYSLKMPINDSTYGKVVASQVIPVNKNGVYTLSFQIGVNSGSGTYQYEVVAGTDKNTFGTTLVSKTNVSTSSYIIRVRWQSNSKPKISVGSNTYICIRFYAPSSGTRTHYLDDVTLTATTVGDNTTHANAVPTMESFGTRLNRPTNDPADDNDPAEHTNNVIKEPGFESTTNAQWNTSAFLTNGVSVVSGGGSDGDAHAGSKFLKYYRGSSAPDTWSAFEVTLPAAGTYVFSAWVRTPGLSANNTGKASIGIINPETGKFLTYGNAGGSYDGHYSNQETQLRSTATDNDWHLRSVTFSVVAAAKIKIGMYGLKSTMYVDDISIHLEANGVEYKGNQHATVNESTSVTNKYCEHEDNLIPDCNMNSGVAKEFWSSASGWNQGMLEIAKDPQHASRGNTLHYKGTNTGANKLYNYIKWIYVEPNTNYTISFDYRVAATGNQLMFIDNNIRRPEVFHTADLGAASNSWKDGYAITFNSCDYERIGIVLRNHASAELYLDDFRFFKNDDSKPTEPEEEIIASLKHTGGEKSRMETDGGTYGLAFKFALKTTGVTKDSKYIGNLSNATVNAFEDGTQYKLVKMGAVMTNRKSVGENETLFTLDNLQGDKTVIDINAEKLYNVTDAESSYAVRIVNIPASHKGTMIYARPYYVFEFNGKQITVYGDIHSDSAAGVPDINDGWLEWD